MAAAPDPSATIAAADPKESTATKEKDLLDGDVAMDDGTVAGSGAARPTLVALTPPPTLKPPTDGESLARLAKAKAAIHLWHVQDDAWPLTAAAIGLTIDEIACLVGEQNWTRSAVISGEAVMSRSLIGNIGVALGQLEVSAAAAAAADSAAKEALMHQLQAPPQPACKHRKTEQQAEGAADQEL